MMANPVLVEVKRGNVIESRHRGALSAFDGDGKEMLSIGDVARPVFPRSAVKSIQALPLIESGAADAYGFTDADLALACASHAGETRHADRAASMLARAGLDASALECGAHWPTRQDAMIELARSGASPTALHNNCSGKHSGFVCTCRHLGIGHRGYVKADHRSQEMVREAMEAVTGAAHSTDACGIDGCSIPTYAIPLADLARGFAKMATGQGLGERRAAAAKRLINACMAEPFYVSGTERMDTRLMMAGAGRIFVKVGAEGVYCGALPELGLGFALKCDDGAVRAAETMVAALIARLMKDELGERVGEMARPVMRNWNGIEVGMVRPVGELG
ncbi:MAG: asparaginase [Rhizobiaceae bacterium]|nr:asparaginase [Rhizobiaceae bacterium]